ncbi:MAG TPA: hypothetical protein ENH82_05685 [bacterium]|nr:hypothetical protein [bacterium]
MKLILIVPLIILALLFFPQNPSAQNIYEIRKYTDEDWIKMSTEERLRALNVSNNHAQNQTFAGDFGRNRDLYPRWGYDYYEMEDRYENYAFRGFENYNIIEDRRQKWYYNQFGDRLTKMTTNAGIWFERFNDDGTSNSRSPYGYINATPGVGIDGIWVARESTDDWAVSVVGAGALRTKLTPLTMSSPNMGGMKIDFQSANYQATFVNSRPLSYFGGNTLMVRGLQLRRKIGALTLGANYANMYAVQQTRDKGTDLKGHVSDYAPTPIMYAVRVVDDSPHDGDGPIVQNVKLIVDGIYRPDIQPMIIIDDLRNELVTAVNSKSQDGYLHYQTMFSGQKVMFDHLTIEERSPKYLDYLYMNDYVRGWNTKVMTDNFDLEKGKEYYKIIESVDKPLQVNGNEYVVYLFDLGSIKEKINRVKVELTVSNDYRVQISQIYTKRTVGGHDNEGDNMLHYNAEYWKTMAQADGNIKDGSNLRTITIDFGYEVGNVIYGFDAHFNYLGFKINGEFVTNTHFYMFSDGIPGTGLPSNPPTDITPRDGHRSSQTDHAYYVTVQKDWSQFGFAGELFKMGKFYRPYMNYFNTIKEIEFNNRNDTMRMTMIDDNDDDDQYPDTQYTSKVMGAYVSALQDPDGVFPGNDLDNDGYADNEKNDNSFPDYDEPFLMFDVDPDEFVFGDDFNNNTIPDFREDDMKYDTPYDLDRKGHHFYVRFSPLKNVNLFAGSFRTKGVGLDNRTDDDYFKANLNYDVFGVGNIFAEYRNEKIKDNIQDKFVVVPTAAKHVEMVWFSYTRYKRYLYFDEVEYRNSRVQKLFLDSRIRAIPSVTLENHVKYERNKQLEGTMYDNTFQPKDIVNTFAMVNKFVYTKQWGNWTFSPGIKFRLYKKGRSESLNPLDHYMMRIPLVFLNYTISPETKITLGMQGFKGFEMLYRDYIQSHNDYKQINYVLQIENRTTYWGFDVWGSFGFRLEQINFDEEYRKFEEYKSSSFFARIWMGY